MLAPDQPKPGELPMLYRCEIYPHAQIDPHTFELRVSQGLRNCMAIRTMSIPEYLDWREQQGKTLPQAAANPG